MGWPTYASLMFRVRRKWKIKTKEEKKKGRKVKDEKNKKESANNNNNEAWYC